MQSFGDELRTMQERLRRMDRVRPFAQPLPLLHIRYPLLALLPADAQTRVICYACQGTGARPQNPGDVQHWPCEVCGAAGLVCPACQGKRWVRTQVPAAGARDTDALIMRCPDCVSIDRETDAIIDYITRPEAA